MRAGLHRLRAARPDDAFIRWRVSEVGLGAVETDGDQVGWLHVSEKSGEVWATVLGADPGRVVAILQALNRHHARDRQQVIDGVTVSAQVYPHLPAEFVSPDPGHWSLWTLDPVTMGARTSGAVVLEPDDPRISTLLAHSDSAHVFPGDDHIVRWVGVVRGVDLLAVGAQVTSASGAAHLVSVCTHPDARGAGLAGEVCNALIIAAQRDGVPMIFLEMYTENAPGRRVYSGLGFSEVGTYRSGRLLHQIQGS